MEDLKNSILSKIQEGEIKQTSRFYFLTKDYFFYFLTIVTAVGGMFTTSAILHSVLVEHMQVMRGMPWSKDYLGFAFISIPFLWLGLFALLCIVAWVNYRNTSRSYRHTNALVIVVVVASSFVGGVALFGYGMGDILDKQAQKNLSWYQSRTVYKNTKRDEFLNKVPPAIYTQRLNMFNQKAQYQGLQYIALHPKCKRIKYRCEQGQTHYHDRIGCGCKEDR